MVCVDHIVFALLTIVFNVQLLSTGFMAYCFDDVDVCSTKHFIKETLNKHLNQTIYLFGNVHGLEQSVT